MDYELEDALALRKLKEAAALRGSDLASPTIRVGGQDIVNWLGPMNRLMRQTQGNRMEDEAVARQRELAQQQQGEVDTYNKAVSTPGTKLLRQEGPTVDGGNIPDQQIPLSPEEENQRQMGLSMDALRLPKARAMAEQFVKSGVGFPEKQAQLKAQQDLAREQQAARLQQAREQAAMLEEGRKQRASDSNALKLTLAGIAASNRANSGSNADLQRELLQARIDKLHEGPKPTPAELKKQSADDELLTKIQIAKKHLEENPDAVGLKTMLPNLALQRMNPAGNRTRSAIGELGAEKAHALYGASFSASEQKRADQFIPAIGDSKEMIKDKLDNMEALIMESRARRAGTTTVTPAAPAPTATPAAGYDAEKEKRYQEWKAKNAK